MKRPLLRVALLYVGGILAADLVSVPLPWLFPVALALAGLALAWRRLRGFMLYPALLLAGWTNATLQTSALSPNDLRHTLGDQPNLVTIRGILIETPTVRMYEHDEKPSWRTLARLQATAVCPAKSGWQPAVGRLAVSTPAPLTNLFAGQQVEVMGVAAYPRLAGAPGTFDYRAYLKQQGIYYQLQAASTEDWVILSSPPRPPLADRFRTWARKALAQGLPVEDESLRLEWALTLGWKPALTEDVAEPFIRAATYHIFAVDGLRMAIIFGILFGLLRALGLGRSICGLALLPLLWFYVALTGWPASAIRATVMLTLVIGGWALRRPTDLLNSLFAAALLILVWEPQQLFQAGFQLSFFVVLCLILMLKPMFELMRRLTAPDPLLPSQLQRHWPAFLRGPARYCADILLTSFAAWVGSIPLVAYYFHIITPVSTPANLLAVPLCGLVLISNLASLLLAGWFGSAAELFNHAGWFLMECIRVGSDWFAVWPKAYFYVPAPSLFTIGLYYSVLVAAVTGWLFRPARRLWKFSALGISLVVWGWSCWQACSMTRLTILPANGGTAIYCDHPGIRNDLLLDAGTTNSVQFTLKEFLRAQGVNRLPALLLTHGDLHHMGGAELVRNLFSPRYVYVSPLRFRSPAYRKTLAHFTETPGLVQVLARPAETAGWTVLHPEANDRFSRADDGALVLRGEFFGTRVVLLSDLGRAGQDALLARTPDLHADIVITGLPSTGEALCDALLESIHPKVIIIVDSEFPVSERASQKLRDRLAGRKTPVIYTRYDGAATVEMSHGTWSIRTMNGSVLRGQASEKKSSKTESRKPT